VEIDNTVYGAKPDKRGPIGGGNGYANIVTKTPVVIRGVPQKRCEIHHNWFPKHGRAAQAVQRSAKTKVKNNAYGEKPKAAK